MIQSLDLALTCFQLFSQPEFKQFDNMWKTLHACDDFLEKVLMANFWKTLLVASFETVPGTLLFGNRCLWWQFFLETALMITFERTGHLDVWLARLDLRERLLANLLERI